MMERRIRAPKDKEALINKLTRSDQYSSNGPFLTRAQLLTFAAVYGYRQGSRIPFSEQMGDPIRQEVFARSGYDTIINLLALATTKDPKCLASSEQAEQTRVSIFEEYANGGLEKLRSELHGVDDPLEHMLLLLDHQRRLDMEQVAEIDLTQYRF